MCSILIFYCTEINIFCPWKKEIRAKIYINILAILYNTDYVHYSLTIVLDLNPAANYRITSLTKRSVRSIRVFVIVG